MTEHIITLELLYAEISLSTTDFDSLRCVGKTVRKRKCLRRLSKATRAAIEDSFRLSTSAEEYEDLLDKLADALLCPTHIDQNDTIRKALQDAMESFLLASTPVVAGPSSPPIPVPVWCRIQSTEDKRHIAGLSSSSPAAYCRSSRSSSKVDAQPLASPPTVREQSEFRKYYPKIQTKEQVDRQVEEILRRNYIPRPGYVYMLRSSKVPGFVKIGYSNNPEERIKQHKRCRSDFDEVQDIHQRFLEHAYHTEKMISAYLAIERQYEIVCPHCVSRHIEWFKVDENKALDAVEKARIKVEEKYGKPGEKDIQAKEFTKPKSKPVERCDSGLNVEITAIVNGKKIAAAIEVVSHPPSRSKQVVPAGKKLEQASSQDQPSQECYRDMVQMKIATYHHRNTIRSD